MESKVGSSAFQEEAGDPKNHLHPDGSSSGSACPFQHKKLDNAILPEHPWPSLRLAHTYKKTEERMEKP